QVAFRVTVEPDDVAYTTSRPWRSTGDVPWFATSTNSSEADDPPVWISETTREDGGHATTPASTGVPPPATSEAVITRTTSAADPARRARSIGILPAGADLVAGGSL